MLRSRFLWTLYAGYSVLILLTAVTVGGLITRRVEKDARDEIRQSLRARAVLLREVAVDHMHDPSDADFQAHILALGKEIGTRLTIIRADGVVLADTENNPAEMDNHANRPEILSVRSHGSGTAVRFSDTVGTEMMYLALPVRRDGELLGYVRTSLSLAAIGARLDYLRTAEYIGVGIAVVVALVLGFVLARRRVKPLAAMTEVAESMAGGDYKQRVSTAARGEIGKLARALNQMAESCRVRMDTISADRNKLSAVLSGMVEGVVAVDQNERVLHMNAAAGRVLGASPEESVNKPIWEITRVGEVCEIISSTLKGEVTTRRDLRLITSGDDKVLEMDASPLHDGKGGLAGAVVVLHDVSELHRLEMIRRDFVANASHELKTPITAIRGLVETMIDDDGMIPQRHERFLEKIKNQSLRLSSIVTDLLTLSRLESDKSGVEGTTLDMRDVVTASIEALAQSAEEEGVEVEARLQAEPADVMGDEDELSLVVNNLLDNALKYTPKGGRVEVRVLRENGSIVVEVEDTGIGIEPADQKRIFERFYRVDKARSRELGGTGLGLSIVKHIVLAHGGQVAVASMPGHGSTFRIVLPARPADA